MMKGIKITLEQKKFINFIMDHVQNKKQEEANVLLLKMFADQANDLDNDMHGFILNIIPLLKEDAIEEVENIIKDK